MQTAIRTIVALLTVLLAGRSRFGAGSYPGLFAERRMINVIAAIALNLLTGKLGPDLAVPFVVHCVGATIDAAHRKIRRAILDRHAV